jgi:WD40 repeat protein
LSQRFANTLFSIDYELIDAIRRGNREDVVKWLDKSADVNAIPGMVILWDAITGAALQTLEGYSDGVVSVAFSTDGKQVVFSSWDKIIRLWDAGTGATLQTLEGHSDMVVSVAFSTDSKQVVSGSWDETVRLWDTATGAAL